MRTAVLDVASATPLIDTVPVPLTAMVPEADIGEPVPEMPPP